MASTTITPTPLNTYVTSRELRPGVLMHRLASDITPVVYEGITSGTPEEFAAHCLPWYKVEVERWRPDFFASL